MTYIEIKEQQQRKKKYAISDKESAAKEKKKPTKPIFEEINIMHMHTYQCTNSYLYARVELVSDLGTQRKKEKQQKWHWILAGRHKIVKQPLKPLNYFYKTITTIIIITAKKEAEQEIDRNRESECEKCSAIYQKLQFASQIKIIIIESLDSRQSTARCLCFFCSTFAVD